MSDGGGNDGGGAGYDGDVWRIGVGVVGGGRGNGCGVVILEGCDGKGRPRGAPLRWWSASGCAGSGRPAIPG